MFSFIEKYKVAIIVLLAIVVIVVIAIRVTANGDYGTVAPVVGDLIRTVKVSGKVIPQNDASLGFETSGTVARVYRDVGNVVSRGTVIAELDQSSLIAELAEARAELAKIDGASTYETKTENAKRSTLQAIRDAYTEADDAIHNKVDQLFDNPKSQNPEIIFAFDSLALRDSINRQRVVIEDTISAFRVLKDRLTISSYTDGDLLTAKTNLTKISAFLDSVAEAVNDFEPNGGLTQTTIDKYRTDVTTARQNVNSAAAALISQGDKLRESVSDVPVQAARVALAEARLAKSRLVAPFTGVISTQDAEVGETVSVGSPLVRLISQSYEIETYVPEVSIAGVALGNPAMVTLDAYGTSVLFPASVAMIDPAETIKDGVSTYKVTLVFTSPDARIRSGMTANIEIETLRKASVLLIPERIIVRDSSTTSVYVLVGDKESEKREVVVGERDSSGNVEIISGVSIYEALLINPPKN
jgi:multidrug resistance efflux pump